MPKERYLVLRSREGDQALSGAYKSAETALSLAITRATRHDAKEGCWTVLEWSHPVYRVTRDEHGDCLVEILP